MADKRIPNSRIREVWLDLSLTTAEAAAAVGLSRSNLWRRAVALGLPARRVGNQPRITDDEMFRRMWAADVGIAEIARFFRVHWQTPSEHRRRLGIPPRVFGGHRRPLTLEQFFADEAQRALAEGLARAAARENAAMRVRDRGAA